MLTHPKACFNHSTGYDTMLTAEGSFRHASEQSCKGACIGCAPSPWRGAGRVCSGGKMQGSTTTVSMRISTRSSGPGDERFLVSSFLSSLALSFMLRHLPRTDPGGHLSSPAFLHTLSQVVQPHFHSLLARRQLKFEIIRYDSLAGRRPFLSP